MHTYISQKPSQSDLAKTVRRRALPRLLRRRGLVPVPALRPQVHRRVRRRRPQPQGGVVFRRLRRPRPQARQFQVQEGTHVGHVHQDVQGEIPQPGIQVSSNSTVTVTWAGRFGLPKVLQLLQHTGIARLPKNGREIAKVRIGPKLA